MNDRLLKIWQYDLKNVELKEESFRKGNDRLVFVQN